MTTQLGALLVCGALAAGAGAQTFAVTPDLQAGQKISLTVTKSRQDSRAGRSGGSTTPVSVRVLEAGPGGSVVEWLYGETQVSDPGMANNPIVKSTMNAVRGIRLEAKLNAAGEFEGLRNGAEVGQKLQSVLGTMTAQIGAQLPDEAARKQVIAALTRSMSPEVMIASASKDIGLYFAASGKRFRVNVPIASDVETASPMGGGAIRSRVEWVLREIAQGGAQARIGMRQTFDPKSTSAATAQSVSALAGKDVSQAMPDMTIVDDAEFLVSAKTGVPDRVTHTRKISAGSAVTRTDTTEIRVVRAN